MLHSRPPLIRARTTFAVITLCLLSLGPIHVQAEPATSSSSTLLVQALESEDTYVRHKAAQALETLSPESASPALLVALESEDTFVRHKATQALQIFAPHAADVVKVALGHEDAYVRHNAAKLLVDLSYGDFVRLMEIALESEDSHVRHVAAQALDSRGAERDWSMLLIALKSRDESVRHTAAKSLEAIAEGVPVEVMKTALLSDDPFVRHNAAWALDNLGPQTFVPVMTMALDSDDPFVRRKAAEFLATQDPDAWQNAWHVLITPEPAQPATPAAAAEPRAPTPWHSARYLGWEHKWSASWPYAMDDITEEDLLVRYNRVEGPFLGWQLARSYHGRTGIAHFGHGGYGFGAEQWQFQTGGEIYTFYGPPEVQSHLATIGAEIHDVADSQDGWLISEEENSVAALFLRRDFQDFYRRFGWSAYTAHNVGGILHMTLRYGRDEFESQASSVSWALHDTRFSRDDFRANPAVSEGIVSSARVDVQLDTRNNRRNPWQGWFINGLFERAGGVLEGDYTFKRYLLDLRRYQPVSLGTRLDLRLRTGTAKEDLVTQYLYDLGGISTLRGYGFKQFTGDRMVLLNLEYWVDADRHWHNSMPIQDLGIGVFFDVGSAWFANDASDPFEGVSEPELKRSFGFGFGDKNQDFRIDLARPLDGDDESWQALVRLGRSF